MHELSDEQEKQFLGEVLKDKLDAIMEVVSDVPHIKMRVDSMDEHLKALESRAKVSDAILRDHEKLMAEHSRRTEEHDKRWKEHDDQLKKHRRVIKVLQKATA